MKTRKSNNEKGWRALALLFLLSFHTLSSTKGSRHQTKNRKLIVGKFLLGAYLF
ncbi:hypothetical protein HMPREF0083_03143 [Aneurinibacillus aneurinilyticus ATCC 12856]|uniref:Uncharacterized protein n=1 Tax=Aneurinibacillus aneurinilyticus ATCC 12856 TaxID=649747 RepID=U1YDB6_ANEAE|nr:hypothetical protein HMPREF0083_03143 [Aneurinibacillus aneurinilyticus ATCC 12856]